MFKKRSKLLFIIIVLESILSIWSLFYFNYLDRLSYKDSVILSQPDLALLIENMFTNSWWALIILTISLITIFSIISFVYRDLKFQLMSILLWFVLFIIALDSQNILSTLMIFIPIIILNIVSYYKHKSKIK